MTSYDTDEALARARGTLDRVKLQSFEGMPTARRRREGRGLAKRVVIW